MSQNSEYYDNLKYLLHIRRCCAILKHELNISEETFRIIQTEGGGVSGESHPRMGAEGARFYRISQAKGQSSFKLSILYCSVPPGMPSFGYDSAYHCESISR